MTYTNMTKRIIDIPANTSGFQAILASTTSRRVVVDESQITAEGVTNTPQGVLDYQIQDDNTTNGFTTVFRAVASTEGIIGDGHLPIVLGSPVSDVRDQGAIFGQVGQPILGVPNANVAANTTLLKIRSGTATATSIVVTEYN